MIRVDGTVSHLSGSMTELLCDLTRIIKHMKETFSKDVGEDQTRETRNISERNGAAPARSAYENKQRAEALKAGRGGDLRGRQACKRYYTWSQAQEVPYMFGQRTGRLFSRANTAGSDAHVKESDSRLKELKEVHDALLIAQFGMVTRGEGL